MANLHLVQSFAFISFCMESKKCALHLSSGLNLHSHYKDREKHICTDPLLSEPNNTPPKVFQSA
eukprot:Gb_28073 [translate_table: standard]